MYDNEQNRYTEGRFRAGEAPEPTERTPDPVQYDLPTPRIKTHHRHGGKKKSWER